jgi:peptidoglycan/xylan/chitin deacetylase (PgdA/CDA1 family)/GT2 family glycosyltransferase
MPAAGPESAGLPLVSVVIPAWQAADTLPETLQSLCSQTLRQWEAIVVDDGSTDGTAAVAEHAARRDSRIRVVRGPHAGVGAARNRGLAEARAPWLLFLDADDWLEPTHLERTTGATGPDVGAVVCGFARVAADGTRGEGILPSWADDPFPAFAGTCRGTTHAYVVRRDLVEEVGAFDPALVICEDWDLWHRIARSGARFVAVPEILALYRMRPGSATSDARRFVADGFEVLRRTHAPDPRVHRPGRHAAGMPAEELPRRRLLFMAWVAGTVVGAGGDPSSLLDLLRGAPAADADPSWLAEELFEAVPVGAATTARAWPQLWPSIATALSAFLDTLDERSSGPSVAGAVRRSLERLVIDSADDRPLTIGSTHAVRLEVTEPVADVVTPPDADRLHVDVEIETAPVGLVELPVVNRRVTAAVLADSIAAAHAWPILGRFFSRTIYDGTADDSEARHDEVGWTVFLRELWGRSTWEGDAFYDPTTPEDPGTRAQPQAGWLVVEVADELPAVGPGIGHLSTVVEVGGSRIALLRLDTRAGLTAQELRAAISAACGFELCVAAVREGVLGAPLTGSLRDRLSAAAHARRSGSAAGSPDGVAPNSARVVAEATGDRTPTLVLAAHPAGAVGSAASRRVVLPSTAAPALSQLAARAGQPSWRWPDANAEPVRVVYAPDLLWHGLATPVGPAPTGTAEPNVRHESAQKLRLLRWRRPRRALEIGCSGGGPLESAPPPVTDRLPILLYHRVAGSGPVDRARRRVTPAAFDEQLAYLRDAGFRGVTVEEWGEALRRRRPLPGRCVLITFDGGYVDFLTDAWPRLRRHSFPATLFVAPAHVGGTNDWDQAHGETVALLDWPALRDLRGDGVRFGAHGWLHRRLAGLSPAQIAEDGARARAVLEDQLQQPVTAAAYPHGSHDPVVTHLLAGCGYLHGLTCNPGRSSLHEHPLSLSRVEIRGRDDLPAFVARLGDLPVAPDDRSLIG